MANGKGKKSDGDPRQPEEKPTEPTPLEALEGRLTNYVDQAIQNQFADLAVNMTNKIDTMTTNISAQVKEMQKSLVEAQTVIAQEVVKQNMGAFTAQIKAELDQKAAELRTEAQGRGGNNAQGQPAGGGILGSLANIFPGATITDFTELVKVFKPQPTNDVQIMGEIGRIFRWHDMLTKIEKGIASGGDIEKTLTQTFTQKP